MATTRYKIAEQAMLIINGGRVGNASKVHINELKIAVNQLANQALKMEYFQINVPMQEMIPNGAAIATYENIIVTKYKNVSKSVLPCYPLKLPRGMGVFQIMNPDDVNACFIPLEMSMAALVSSQGVLSDLLGHTGFEVYGTNVVYTKDLTLPSQDVYVTIRLVVLDINQYSDWDILPLAPEQEWQIINEVVRLYGPEPPADKLVDPGIKERGMLKDQIQK